MSELVSESQRIAATSLKDEGNAYLKRNMYSLAADKYTDAISLNPHDAIYYANRAQAYILMESYGLAIADANQSIS